MIIEMNGRNGSKSIIDVSDLRLNDLQVLIKALDEELELRVKEKESSQWRDDDTPEYEMTSGTCRLAV